MPTRTINLPSIDYAKGGDGGRASGRKLDPLRNVRTRHENEDLLCFRSRRIMADRPIGIHGAGKYARQTKNYDAFAFGKHRIR